MLITVPYHVRDAERLRGKHGKRCTIWGHEACASRLTKRAGFHPITPETELPAGVRAHAIGSPRRQEQPLWIPSHKALAFGDAVIETGDRLQIWEDDLDNEQRSADPRPLHPDAEAAARPSPRAGARHPRCPRARRRTREARLRAALEAVESAQRRVRLTKPWRADGRLR